MSGEQDMKFKFAIAFTALAAAGFSAAAQEAQTYPTEVPNLSQCIERAGADGEATQEELDNCINSNLGEVRAAMPDVTMDTPDETPYRMNDAMTGETAEGDTEEES